MGDLVLTCTGDLSRNRQVGLRLASGQKLLDILGEMKMVAEGVKTTEAVHSLRAKLGVEMPITEQVYAILYENKEPSQAVRELMAQGPGHVQGLGHGRLPGVVTEGPYPARYAENRDAADNAQARVQGARGQVFPVRHFDDHGHGQVRASRSDQGFGHGGADLLERSGIDGRAPHGDWQSGQGHPAHARTAVDGDGARWRVGRRHPGDDGRAVGYVRVVTAVLDDDRPGCACVQGAFGHGQDEAGAIGERRVHPGQGFAGCEQPGCGLGRCRGGRAGGEALAQGAGRFHACSAQAATKASATAGLLPKWRCT